MLQARDATQVSARQALASLCEAYWYPLYSFLRRQGSNADEAADLIQGYFARFLEKGYIHDVHRNAGRFRSFLLASLKHFAANERARSRALKRGGGIELTSLDLHEAERRYAIEPLEWLNPETLYERTWARTLSDRALEHLRERARSAGKGEQFELFEPHLTGEGPERRYRELAQRLEMSEGAVKVAIHRLRLAYGKCLRDEVAETVAEATDLDDEVRYLLTVLRDARGGGH